MRIDDRLLPLPPLQVGMHHVADDRPRPDDRHLDDDVVEALRLEPRQRRHLRARLDLEDADRLGGAQHPAEHVVEIEVGGSREADRVDARDDERTDIWAREAAFLQLVDNGSHRIVDLENLVAAALALLEGGAHGFVEEGISLPEDGLIRATADEQRAASLPPPRSWLDYLTVMPCSLYHLAAPGWNGTPMS